MKRKKDFKNSEKNPKRKKQYTTFITNSKL